MRNDLFQRLVLLALLVIARRLIYQRPMPGEEDVLAKIGEGITLIIKERNA